MRCFICGLTSKDFNSLDKTGVVNVENLKFGLSTLHARIRFFEAILHLSYKIPVKKWQIKSQEDKEEVKKRKKIIQEEFRKKMGLIVDVPKANYGNTNDGNTSRRFFSDVELASEITSIDFNLIYRFKVILEAITSGHDIKIKEFTEYTQETAKLYVELYPWHPMTPTLHKILIHGPEVIQNALLPIGQLSEEAAEARNKYIRLFRLGYSRKFSRVECNIDVLNRLLLTSDPFMTGRRTRRKKKSEPFLKETISLLKCCSTTHDFTSDEDE